MLRLLVTTSRFLRSQKLKTKENYLKLLTIVNAVANLRWRETTSTSYLNWMAKREQVVTPPTVADLPYDNPRLILVEFISGFVSFAKRINTPVTLAQGRNRFSAWICMPMKRSGKQPTADPSRIYQRICIFCETDKYTRNSRTREEQIQCVDMHADETIRKAAVGKTISESWLSSVESLRLLKHASISHAIAITPEISLSVR